MSLKPQNQLTNLVAYSGAFVTVRQLAEYWDVSRKHVLKLIETGGLESIRLGPKTYRVRVQAALEFEQRNRNGGLFVTNSSNESTEPRQSRHGT
jgi:excisionase family DNA binding protein